MSSIPTWALIPYLDEITRACMHVCVRGQVVACDVYEAIFSV